MKNRLSNIIQYVNILCKYTISAILSLFDRRHKGLWIISERGNEARDNGWYLFKFIKSFHPEIECYYVITKNSNDYYKTADFKKFLIEKGSIKHYVLLQKASKLIGTHIYSATPDGTRFKKLNQKFKILKDKKIIFLQHGIIKEIVPIMFYENLKVDLFVSGAKIEYDLIDKHYHYPPGIVKYTGLPRYDGLNDFSTKKQILFMPTWRLYLNSDNFFQSEYYEKVLSLLNSKDLKCLLEKSGYKLVFFPHLGIQPFLDKFKRSINNNAIVIADWNNDVQTLLKESEILLTDYSSVFFDFAYMKKPVLSYHFDETTYYSKHYPKGEYDGGLFGPVVCTEEEVIKSLNRIIDNGSIMEIRYKANVDKVFPMRDGNNCRRVFEAIDKL